MNRTSFSIRSSRNVRSTDRPLVPPCNNSTRLHTHTHSAPYCTFISLLCHFIYFCNSMKYKIYLAKTDLSNVNFERICRHDVQCDQFVRWHLISAKVSLNRGYWCQKTDDRLADPPKKCNQEPLVVQDRDERFPRGPPGGALLLCAAAVHCWEISLG